MNRNEKPITRRELLRSAGTAGVAALIGSTLPTQIAAGATGTEEEARQR